MNCDRSRTNVKIRSLSLICCLLLFYLPASCYGQASEAAGFLGEGKPWETPYYVKDSGVSGPTIVITGGIHGNEPSGAYSAAQIRHWPIVCGKMIVVPRANTQGLAADTRYIPNAPEELQDLNRDFPSLNIADQPKGEIATALWELVVDHAPDWLFDLHEGYEFNISHQPKQGKKKSVGSSIIFNRQQGFGPLVERMLTAANGTVTDPDRKFVLLSRGPKKTSLANAAIEMLDANGMILETTFQFQRLPIRTNQHRRMMNVALRHLAMIDRDCVDVMTPPTSERGQQIFVALFDDQGGSERGVGNLTRAFEASGNLNVAHLGAGDIRPEVLSQFDVVVFGGGSGSRQASTIGKEGAEAVRDFVRNGGGYVGVCGGAFLCSAHYSWSLNLIDTHVLTGAYEVEGQGRKQMWYRGNFSSQKMQLTDEGRKIFSGIPEHISVEYQNGPIVSPKHRPGLTGYKTLAHFRSEKVLHPPQKGTMINTPAIVMGDFGEGKVISISPHPEATEGLETMLSTAVTTVARTRQSP